MLESLKEHCKDQRDLFTTARVIAVEEKWSQNADFFVIGWMLDALAKEKKITFVAVRQNYSHYLSLSKKLGKSIEGYLKNKQLTYIESFESSFCSELPLVEFPPSTYVSPPSLIKKIYSKDLMKEKQLFEEAEIMVIDSIGYIDDIQLSFWLYQRAMMNECQLVLGGCSEKEDFTRLIECEAQLIVRLQNDVGGYGKFNIIGNGKKNSVLWKSVNNQLQFSQQITI